MIEEYNFFVFYIISKIYCGKNFIIVDFTFKIKHNEIYLSNEIIVTKKERRPESRPSLRFKIIFKDYLNFKLPEVIATKPT